MWHTACRINHSRTGTSRLRMFALTQITSTCGTRTALALKGSSLRRVPNLNLCSLLYLDQLHMSTSEISKSGPVTIVPAAQTYSLWLKVEGSLLIRLVEAEGPFSHCWAETRILDLPLCLSESTGARPLSLKTSSWAVTGAFERSIPNTT